MDKEVCCQEVIVSTLARRGDGKTSPIRAITQVFSKEGNLIAEHDPHTFNERDMVAFARWLHGANEPPSINALHQWRKIPLSGADKNA